MHPPSICPPPDPLAAEAVASTIDAILVAARAQLDRVTPERAAAEVERGALLVDTRPVADRRRYGEIPGAAVIERNVLEWRLDPTSPARIPSAETADLRVILFCNEGYASSLAALSLHGLGLSNATDMIGGFHAWSAAGLPVVPAGTGDGENGAHDT